MLERYFIRPTTVDRIRASWLAGPIEQYVAWLAERGYRQTTIRRRVPLLMDFGEFARGQGATRWAELPSWVDAFVEERIQRRLAPLESVRTRRLFVAAVRSPIEQMLTLVVQDSGVSRRACAPAPFADVAPGFLAYLREERGLQPITVKGYTHHLQRFEKYLGRVGLGDLAELSAPVISGFITQRATRLAPKSMKPLCTAVRVFLRYAFREGLTDRDMSHVVEPPQAYRLSHLPRSISWGDVKLTLDAVDRRWALGKRDYAILLLLVTYGLRAREVAKLTLDDIDWRNETLRIPQRKAGHSTSFPLSPVVGGAIVDYLRNGRPEGTSRHLFWKLRAPPGPMSYSAVAARAGHYLRRAGITVRRPGSHTLRHTCVQRLVDADFSLKTIGDYIGHRSPSSTEIYTKVDVEALRQVALGDGEDVL